MPTALRPSRRSKGQRMSLRHRWQKLARRADMQGRRLGLAGASAAIGRSRRELMAIGDAIESASARQLVQACRRVSVAANRGRARRLADGSRVGSERSTQLTLEPGQRRTLEVGSCVILSGLGLGYQLGGWPAWSVLAAAGVYAGWVVLYAEVTVQAKRRPGLWQRWPWRPRPRSRGRATVGPASPPASQPAQEQGAT
jgi:hypothetical protein